MQIIRGATTIKKDEKQLVIDGVKTLLDEIFSINSLEREEIVGIVFSVTTDIHSFHPAKAARISGYDYAPLFACIEPEIVDGLALCIRVMVMTELSRIRLVKHVYLENAKMLRTDLTSVYNIALDGPAGSGKSTVAKILAKEYNILYLDTGAMYRACALKAIRENVNPQDRNAVEELVKKLDVKVEYLDGTQHTYLDGEDVSDKIRVNAVSMAASHISAHPCVRVKMVEMQRVIAKQMSCILDGRDIGSDVLPDAKFKFFLTADSKIRAKRRYDELIEKGQTVDFDELHAEIVQRDKQDSERDFSPLVCAVDAIVIDTSYMSIDEVVATLKSYVQQGI